MSVSSMSFLISISILFVLYWYIPFKYQWILLTMASMAFFIINSEWFTIVYVLLSVVSVYFAAIYFEGENKHKRFVLTLTIIFNIAILAVLKYTNLFVSNIYRIMGKEYVWVEFIAPLAISFYTLQLIAYLLDCYWGIVIPERKILRLFLYTIYFPQMISGPISRFGEMEYKLFEEHKFEYIRVVRGIKRIGFGLAKKLVISSRFAIFADSIFNDTTSFSGIWIWFGMAFFVLQLYTDFSGCMDIILGTSLCLGIELKENFDAPLLSRSVQEFWQRWHITLGAWLRDYILNSCLKSHAMLKLGNYSKKLLGKKSGKKVPVYISMLIVWLVIGIWHGSGLKYIVGMGIWFWLIIILEKSLSPYVKNLCGKLRINFDNPILNGFRIIRTFILVCIGNTFFRAESFTKAIEMIKQGFYPTVNFNLVTLLKEHGISRVELGDITGIIFWIISMVYLIYYEVLTYSGKDPLDWLSGKNKGVRWMVYWSVAIMVAFSLSGKQSAFIYARF